MPDVTLDRHIYFRAKKNSQFVDFAPVIEPGSLFVSKLLFADEFKFGRFCSTRFEAIVKNDFTQFEKDDFSVSLYENGDAQTGTQIPILTGAIESASVVPSGLNATDKSYQIIAYDKIFTIGKKNVAEWWENYWVNKTNQSLYSLRRSLLNHVGLSEATDDHIPNDTIIIPEKPIEINRISFLDMFEYLTAISGTIPYLSADGVKYWNPERAAYYDFSENVERINSELNNYDMPLYFDVVEQLDIDGNVITSASTENPKTRISLTYNPILSAVPVNTLTTALETIQSAYDTTTSSGHISALISDPAVELGSYIDVGNNQGLYAFDIELSNSLLVDQQFICAAIEAGEDAVEEYSPEFSYLVNKLNETAEELQDEIDNYEPSEAYTAKVQEFSSVMMQGLGLKTKTITDPQTGAKIVYYYAPASAENPNTMTGSKFVFVMKSTGLAWTDKWEGSSDGTSESHTDSGSGETIDTSWSQGIGADGSSIVKILNAYKISADCIDAGVLEIKDPDSGDVVHQFSFNDSSINIGDGAITYDTDNGLQIDSTVVYGAVEDAVADLDLSGVTLTGETIAYAVSSSGTTPPVENWRVDDIPTVQPGQYLWTKVTLTFEDGEGSHDVESYSVAKQGENGQQGQPGTQGDTGRGIVSVVQEYYLSNSSQTPSGGEWSETPIEYVNVPFAYGIPENASAENTIISGLTLESGTTYTIKYKYAESSSANSFIYLRTPNGASQTNLKVITVQSGTSEGSVTYTPTDDYSDCYIVLNPNTKVINYQIQISGGDLVEPHYYFQRDKITWTTAPLETYTTHVLMNGLNKALIDANEANSAIGAWCYNNDKTVIDGGKIMAGTVTADYLRGRIVEASNIVAGTITGNEIDSDTIEAKHIKAGAITIGGLDKDLRDMIEQGSDGIDVHGTAGAISSTTYTVTTEEKPDEITEGMTFRITFANGISFVTAGSGGYSARYVKFDSKNTTYELRNFNNTARFCNVKNSSDYSAANTVVDFEARGSGSNIVLCEAIWEDDMQSATLAQNTGASDLKLQTLLSSPTPGTALTCDYSSLSKGLGFYSSSSSPSNYSCSSPNLKFSSNTGNLILSKAQYSSAYGIASAYQTSELDSKGSQSSSANYTGTCSTSASSQMKTVTLSTSNVTPYEGLTVLITFTYGNTADYVELNFQNATELRQMVYDPNTSRNMMANSAYNWSAGQSRLFTWQNGGWYIGNVPATYYFSPKDKTSVNIILENLKTSSSAGTLRAFEMRYEPTKKHTISPDVQDAIDSAVEAAMSGIESEVTTFYGTCGTAAGTAAKVVNVYKSDGSTLDDSFTLKKGVIINVSFSFANTATTPTLNVNSTGAKSIYVNGSQLHYGSSYTTNAYNWKAGNVVQFMYDGSYWRMSQTSADLILANLCADNNMTVIDGSKIYAGTVTSKKIQANSIFATDALLANLLAKNATITGNLKINNETNSAQLYIYQKDYDENSSTYSTDLTNTKNALAKAAGYTSYNNIPYDVSGTLLRLLITREAPMYTIMTHQASNSPLVLWNHWTDDDQGRAVYYAAAALCTAGLLVGNTSDGIFSPSLTNTSYYGVNSKVAGDLTVNGDLYLPHVAGKISFTMYSTSGTITYQTITFDHTYSSAPKVHCTLSATGSGFQHGFVYVYSTTTTQANVCVYFMGGHGSTCSYDINYLITP